MASLASGQSGADGRGRASASVLAGGEADEVLCRAGPGNSAQRRLVAAGEGPAQAVGGPPAASPRAARSTVSTGSAVVTCMRRDATLLDWGPPGSGDQRVEELEGSLTLLT